jgi:hypothetical protein
MDWKQTLARLDADARTLQPLIERFLEDGATEGLAQAIEALVSHIPDDVLARTQHPLTITSKALSGTLRQAMAGRALFSEGAAPDWWPLLADGVSEALDDFDRELALLMKEGEKTH